LFKEQDEAHETQFSHICYTVRVTGSIMKQTINKQIHEAVLVSKNCRHTQKLEEITAIKYFAGFMVLPVMIKYSFLGYKIT
jgi:hypothetical protein